MGPTGNAVSTTCPVHGRLRHSAATDNSASDQASARHQVEWAGLPINLDLAFSREQCDKVYVQHLMRKRGTELWRLLHDGAHSCVCDSAAAH